MAGKITSLKNTALLIVDLQNDFIHPDGAYAKGGAAANEAQALPPKIKPLANALRQRGGIVAATQFTLVPGRGGEPMISPHLLQMRPFLKKGDFLPGGWGHQVVDDLQPIDIAVEKIAYSAFYQTRLEWMLRKLDIQHLVVGGIVTNGGVASTVRDAHVRDIDVTVIEDGCAAPTPVMHSEAIAALKPVARIATIKDVLAEIEAL